MLSKASAFAQEMPPETTVEAAHTYADGAWAYADENRWQDTVRNLQYAIAASPDECLDGMYGDYLAIAQEEALEMQQEGASKLAM